MLISMKKFRPLFITEEKGIYFYPPSLLNLLSDLFRLPSYNLHHPAIKNKVVTEYHSITTLFFLQ